MTQDPRALIIRKATQIALGAKNRMEASRQRVADSNRKLEEQHAAFAAYETNVIFAVDATASRANFWKQTKILQNEMFSSVESAGGKLTAQLVSYSGDTQNKKIYATPWHDSAFILRDYMEGIECVAGHTQVAQVFRHAIRECASRKIGTLILVVDSCEEQEYELVPLAESLNQKGIRLFLFDDEQRSTARHNDTPKIFQSVVQAAKGIYAPFDMNSLDVLEDYLKTVAVLATGNEDLIDKLHGSVRTARGKAMLKEGLRQLKLTGPK